MILFRTRRTWRLFAVATLLALAHVSLETADAQTKKKQAKLVERYCIYLTSWDYQRTNYAKLYYEFRWRRLDNKGQPTWHTDTLGYLGSTYTSIRLCATRNKPLVLEVQLDQSARPGYQIKRFRLLPERFRVAQGMLPNMACFTSKGLYHFAGSGRTILIRSGAAPNIKWQPTCRWTKARR